MDFQQEILGICARLFHDRRIVAAPNLHLITHLVKYKFHCNLRRVSSLDEHTGAIGECVASISLCYRLRRRKAGFDLAGVLAKLASGQAVVGTLGILSAE